ncbi:hypothetical protein TRICI_006850 [Trichomonascus ciferrii]|uniref:Uncharacterized protein n=1 Tax=Trichomonascus ciferrii TaxID=44093 RepID=A0A642UES0_9ASCO|nr:hypothetical protein TRICI_006850 [Trichomonascus ciferrii]
MSFNYSGPPAKLTAPQSLETLMVTNCTFPFRNKNQPPTLSLPIKTLRIGCVTHSNLLKCIHLPNLTEVSWTDGGPCHFCEKSHVDWIAHKLTSMEYAVLRGTKELVLRSVREAKELHYNSLSSAPLKNLSLTYCTMDLSPDCFPLPQGHKSLEFIGVTISHFTEHYEESAFSAISHVDIVGLLGGQECLSNKFPRLKTVSLQCEYTYCIDAITNTPPFVDATQFIHAQYTVQNGSPSPRFSVGAFPCLVVLADDRGFDQNFMIIEFFCMNVVRCGLYNGTSSCSINGNEIFLAPDAPQTHVQAASHTARAMHMSHKSISE